MAAELTDELGSDPAADAYVAAYLADGQMAQLASNHPSRVVRALARALVAATQGAEPVGTLYVSKFRGHLENSSFDYTGTLPDGTYPLYTAPPPTAEVEKAFQTCRLLIEYDRTDYLTGDEMRLGYEAVLDSARAALQSDQAQAGKGE